MTNAPSIISRYRMQPLGIRLLWWSLLAKFLPVLLYFFHNSFLGMVKITVMVGVFTAVIYFLGNARRLWLRITASALWGIYLLVIFPYVPLEFIHFLLAAFATNPIGTVLHYAHVFLAYIGTFMLLYYYVRGKTHTITIGRNGG